MHTHKWIQERVHVSACVYVIKSCTTLCVCVVRHAYMRACMHACDDMRAKCVHACIQCRKCQRVCVVRQKIVCVCVCVCVCVSVCLSVRLSCSRSAGILVVEAEDTVLGIGPCSAKGADDGRHVVAGGFHLGDNVRRAACGVDELVGVCHETGVICMCVCVYALYAYMCVYMHMCVCMHDE